jgi:small neutral amino acid transporter SnatA (MarC family)
MQRTLSLDFSPRVLRVLRASALAVLERFALFFIVYVS